MRADVALKESQGELHRLKTDIAAGKYIAIEEVKIDYQKFFVAFKKFAISLPSRLIGMISAALIHLKQDVWKKNWRMRLINFLELS